MNDQDLVMQLAGRWNLPRDAATPIVGDRIVACRWRHALPTFPDTTLPNNTLCLLMARAQSRRRVGNRVTEASRTPQSLGLIPQGSYGAWEFDLPIDVLHIYVPNGALANAALRLGVDANDIALHDKLAFDDPLLHALCREVASSLNDAEAGRLYIDALSGAIESRLLRGHSSAAERLARAARPASGGLAPWQQRRCTELLADRLAEDVSLAELAEQAGLSLFHFCRAFKLSTGEPPHAYQRRLRSEKARELLATTDLPITQIAFAVGYETPQAFARMFRAEVGVTPSAYRRERIG